MYQTLEGLLKQVVERIIWFWLTKKKFEDVIIINDVNVYTIVNEVN